ncbi:hypothetical protein C5L39_06000 [Corynebacterium alimapuense]|uniref:Uncharacterized protein n=1 Tax=Corynebacterium alimapuense TaxID=1576874 RepID=A0A3M8K763_9CORY|nr:hypothetical protein C5L39_06000 [Corynebacterium alimapuense]
MEFEEFSRQFRKRTTQRMLEFEKALAKAQERVERTATAPRPNAARSQPQRGQPRGRVQSVLRKS